MAFTEDQLEDYRIWFDGPGHASVLVGPCSGSPWHGEKIPLDGRHYSCAGRVILKNGRELFANLPVRTHTFDFLDWENVYCNLEGRWYGVDEPCLYEQLGLTPDEALPFTWVPDIPLDYSVPGPYPMVWHAPEQEQVVAHLVGLMANMRNGARPLRNWPSTPPGVPRRSRWRLWP